MHEEMSDDEVFTMLIALVIALVAALRWYVPLIRVTTLGSRPGFRVPLFLTPLACLAILVCVLVRWSAKEVRSDPRYIALFLLVGAAWIAVFGGIVLPLLGLSVREDAVERRNPAAVMAACGALLGAMLCFAGANMGEGPTIWTTIGPAFVATGTLALLLVALQLATGIVTWIVIDRDTASGLRLAGLLVASGLVLGRGVAGDYGTAGGMLRDLASQGWPAPVLMVLTIVFSRVSRPTPRTPKPEIAANGALPSLVFLAVATAWVVHLGPW